MSYDFADRNRSFFGSDLKEQKKEEKLDEKVNCKKEYRYLTEYSFKLFTCIGRKHMTPKTILIVEDNREISDMLST